MSRIRDRVMWFSTPAVLRTLLVRIVNVLQREPAQHQILGAGLAFYTMARGAGLNPHDIITMLHRMESDVDAPFANQFRAMMEYSKGELN